MISVDLRFLFSLLMKIPTWSSVSLSVFLEIFLESTHTCTQARYLFESPSWVVTVIFIKL